MKRRLQKQLIALSRRDFLTKTAVVGIAAMFPFAIKSEAFETFWDKFKETVPPGIANCRDIEILKSYYYMQHPNQYYLGDQRFTYKKLLFGIYSHLRRIDNDTPYIEPAFWFMANKLRIYPKEEIYDKYLKEKNLSLYYFSKGITMYFTKWIRGRTWAYKNEDIETAFLNSIYIAAEKYPKDWNLNEFQSSKPIPQVKEYLNSSIEERKKKLKGIMKIYRSYSIDPKVQEINNNYNKLLVAQWSAFWLVEHYDLKKDKKNGDLLWGQLENQMKNVSTNKIDIRIRADAKKKNYYLREC